MAAVEPIVDSLHANSVLLRGAGQVDQPLRQLGVDAGGVLLAVRLSARSATRAMSSSLQRPQESAASTARINSLRAFPYCTLRGLCVLLLPATPFIRYGEQTRRGGDMECPNCSYSFEVVPAGVTDVGDDPGKTVRVESVVASRDSMSLASGFSAPTQEQKDAAAGALIRKYRENEVTLRSIVRDLAQKGVSLGDFSGVSSDVEGVLELVREHGSAMGIRKQMEGDLRSAGMEDVIQPLANGREAPGDNEGQSLAAANALILKYRNNLRTLFRSYLRFRDMVVHLEEYVKEGASAGMALQEYLLDETEFGDIESILRDYWPAVQAKRQLDDELREAGLEAVINMIPYDPQGYCD